MPAHAMDLPRKAPSNMVNSHLSGEGLPSHRIHSRLELRAGSPLECQPLNSRRERVGDDERERLSGYILVNCSVPYLYHQFVLSFIVAWKYFTKISDGSVSTGGGVWGGGVRFEFGTWKCRMTSHRILQCIVQHSCFVFLWAQSSNLATFAVQSSYFCEASRTVEAQG